MTKKELEDLVLQLDKRLTDVEGKVAGMKAPSLSVSKEQPKRMKFR